VKLKATQPIRAVFWRYELDIKKRTHWVKAVKRLALELEKCKDERPREYRPAGRPGQWNDLALWRLSERVKRVKAMWPEETDFQACARLVKGNREYKGMDPQTLRRRLVAARRVR
jgi:hypothetical protein